MWKLPIYKNKTLEQITMETPKRIFDILKCYKNEHKNLPVALANKEKGQWKKYTPADYYQYSHKLACSLLKLGLQKGDKVASISQNLPQWNITDMGIALAGIIHVPIYPTLNNAEFEYIFTHCEAKVIIVSNAKLATKVAQVVEAMNKDIPIFCFTESPVSRNWDSLITDLTSEEEAKYMVQIEENKRTISPEDLFTIVYTSGTTGNPKGVMLSHRNILSNATEIEKLVLINYGCRALSFLPLCHIYERMMNYVYQIKGIEIYYAESLGTIINDIQDIKPQIFNSVPRVLEKFYDKITAKGKDLKKLQRKIFNWSVELGKNFADNGQNSWWYNFRLKIARQLVFKQWQAAFGGKIVVIVSGGSALSTDLARLFAAAGLKISDGYGLTETSPVIGVNNIPWTDSRIGTIGPVLKGVTVKINDDGEILVKGPNVMMGYYKNEEETRNAIDEEGWFHTGDIGEIIDGKFLKITDRKKEIFKMSNGKYIAPQQIENKLKSSMLIEQAMVIGENEKFASAIISPNFNHLHFYALKHKIHFRDNAELITNAQVLKKFQEEIEDINKTLSEYECIKRFRLVVEEWSPTSGELSPTLKLKRNVIKKKYSSLMNEIYGHSDETQKNMLDNLEKKISHGFKKLKDIGNTKLFNE